jgi:hypothetical protein
MLSQEIVVDTPYFTFVLRVFIGKKKSSYSNVSQPPARGPAPAPCLIKEKEFTGPRPHKGWEPLAYSIIKQTVLVTVASKKNDPNTLLEDMIAPR